MSESLCEHGFKPVLCLLCVRSSSAVDRYLKPCPFCGGKAVFSKDGEQHTKYGNEQIHCTGCFVAGAPQRSEKRAAEWWNTRIADTSTEGGTQDVSREETV